MYENYLEDFVFSAAKIIAEKVLGTDETDADANIVGSEENEDFETGATETNAAKEIVMKDADSQEQDEEDEENNLSDEDEKALIEHDADGNSRRKA